MQWYHAANGNAILSCIHVYQGAKKPADRVMKSVSTPPVKGNPKRTPVAERKPFEGNIKTV